MTSDMDLNSLLDPSGSVLEEDAKIVVPKFVSDDRYRIRYVKRAVYAPAFLSAYWVLVGDEEVGVVRSYRSMAGKLRWGFDFDGARIPFRSVANGEMLFGYPTRRDAAEALLFGGTVPTP